MTDDAHFSAHWLKLREPVDHRSRAHELTALANHYLRHKRRAPPLIVDLAAGCGSNLRYLAARLDGPARWRLLDHDPGLLATVADSGRAQNSVTTETVDLSQPLQPALAGADLVTASALLDLVSAHWIEAFCDACARTGAAVLVALSVDERTHFTPPDRLDALVQAALMTDQRREKGLGPALGTTAPAILGSSLAARGYAVITRASDWRLDQADAALARALIDGWREAAQRQRPASRGAIAAWAERRTASIAHGRARLTVGHLDLFAHPPPAVN